MRRNELKYFAVYKPFGMLSQFTDVEGRDTLAGLYDFPNDVYPVGRLDSDSEGLLLLTNDKKLTDYLLNPRNKHEREYLVQVEGMPSENELRQLQSGLRIKEYTTLQAKAKIVDEPELPPRIPPIRVRKSIPDTWLSICLIEGKNRQVRRMTAAINHPTLRLVRIRIKNILLKNMLPGDVRLLTSGEIFDLTSEF